MLLFFDWVEIVKVIPGGDEGLNRGFIGNPHGLLILARDDVLLKHSGSCGVEKKEQPI